MSQGNLVTALHSHVHAQPRHAHGWRHMRTCPGRPFPEAWSETRRQRRGWSAKGGWCHLGPGAIRGTQEAGTWCPGFAAGRRAPRGVRGLGRRRPGHSCPSGTGAGVSPQAWPPWAEGRGGCTAWHAASPGRHAALGSRLPTACPRCQAPPVRAGFGRAQTRRGKVPILGELSPRYAGGAQSGHPMEAEGAGGWDAVWDLEAGSAAAAGPVTNASREPRPRASPSAPAAPCNTVGCFSKA